MRRHFARPIAFLFLFAACASLTGPAAGAAGPRQQTVELDPDTRTAIVTELADVLERGYVFEDVGARYAAMLRESLDSGAYAQISSAAELAVRLTADLQEVSPDLHLQLRTAPAGRVRGRQSAAADDSEAGPSRGRARQSEAMPDRPAPEAPRAGPPDPRRQRVEDLPPVAAARLALEQRENHFFRAVEILPGNVGYLDYDRFGFFVTSRDTADAAMAFLEPTDAIILDLRGNGGGVEGMHQYLSSHFFGDEPVLLYSRENRGAGERYDFWSWPEEPRRRFPERPLFVLVDASTGSAAENMAFSLQGLGRARVVGEATAGAGHSSSPVMLPGGLMLVLPVARTFNPRTDEGWEGAGVQPDLAARSAAALVAAHGLAIDHLLENAATDLVAELQHARLVVAGQRTTALAYAELAEYEGRYGPFRVWREAGDVRWVRTSSTTRYRTVSLLRVSGDEFVSPEMVGVTVRFERDDAGAIAGLRIIAPGRPDTVEERVLNPE